MVWYSVKAKGQLYL